MASRSSPVVKGLRNHSTSELAKRATLPEIASTVTPPLRLRASEARR